MTAVSTPSSSRTTAPICHTPAARVEDEAVRFCPNIACPSRVLEGIVHYAGRGAMDIRGLGYERVRQLLDAGLIRDVADLYQLQASTLIELDRFAEQSAEQLVQAIANSKAQPLSLLLFGLGIRHVGKQVAQTLARRFGTLDALMAASRDDIDEVPGVGSAIGDAVAEFFGEARNRAVMERLRIAGLELHRAARGVRRWAIQWAERRPHGNTAHAEPREGHGTDRECRWQGRVGGDEEDEFSRGG